MFLNLRFYGNRVNLGHRGDFRIRSLCSSESSVNLELSSNICWASDHVVLYVKLGMLSRISLNNLMFRFRKFLASSYSKNE